MGRKQLLSLASAIALAAGVWGPACASAFDVNPCPDASSPLVCPNHVCCAPGMPYECNGKCYATPAVCGGSYTFCSKYGESAPPSSAADSNVQAPDGGACPSGTVKCGAGFCAPQHNVCCASVGHPELSCALGDVCTSDGQCAGSGGSTGGSSGGGSSSGAIGVPCGTSAHPAWEQGECQPAINCKSCSVKVCARLANGGCCEGYDLGYLFIPCDGSGGRSCGTCTNAAKSALQKCGCTQ